MTAKPLSWAKAQIESLIRRVDISAALRRVDIRATLRQINVVPWIRKVIPLAQVRTTQFGLLSDFYDLGGWNQFAWDMKAWG